MNKSSWIHISTGDCDTDLLGSSWVLVQVKRACAVQLAHPTPGPPFFADSRPPVSKVACLISLYYLLSTCMYHTFSHITFLGYNHMHSRASVFLDSLLSEHISSDDTCVFGGGSFPVTTHVFSSRGVAAVRARRLFPSTISGVRGSVPVLPLGRKLDWQPVLSRASKDSHLAV